MVEYLNLFYYVVFSLKAVGNMLVYSLDTNILF